MNVHEAAATVAQQRSYNLDNLDDVYNTIEYLVSASNAVRGRMYRITGDIIRLERYWRNSGFEDVERDFLRRFMNRDVRVVQIETSDESCQVRFEDTMDNVWVPAQVLGKTSSSDEKPDRRRPEQSATLLRIGDDVRLVRVARADYENTRGRLVQYLPDKDKWRTYLKEFDKIVLVRPSNLEKEKTQIGLQQLTDVHLGAYYKVTSDYQTLAHSLAALGEAVDSGDVEGLVDLLGETIHARSLDPSTETVECVFNSGAVKSLPFNVLGPVDSEDTQPGDDIRDMIGYL